MRRSIVVFGIAAVVALLASSAALADSDTKCSTDSSGSFSVCATINYSVGSYGGGYAVTVQNFQARWTRLDPTVSINNAVFNAKVLAVDTGGTTWATTQSFNVGSPSSGTTYTFTPAWAGHPLKAIVNPWYSYGWATAQLHRGGSSWGITSNYVCAPYSTGGWVSPC